MATRLCGLWLEQRAPSLCTAGPTGMRRALLELQPPPTSHFLSCDQGVESIDRPSSTLSVKVTRISLPQRAKQHVPGLEKHVSRTQEGALARVPDLVLREGQVLEDPALSGQPAPGTEVVPLRPDPASVGQDDNLST